MAASYFDVHWIFIFTSWATALVAFIFLSQFGRQVYFFRRWINLNIVVLLFLSGFLGYQLNSPFTYKYNFNDIAIENDYFIGEITEYQEGKKAFDKVIINVQQIVKPHSNLYAQGELLCYINSDSISISEGHVILFQPVITPIKNKGNPGEFDAEKYWNVKGINSMAFLDGTTIQILDYNYTFSNFWSASRQYFVNVIQTYVSKENQGLVIALTLGDKSKLSIEKRNQFANAGAMHVLAVSGMHVGILLAFLQWIFFLIKPLRKRSLYLYFALIFIWAFAFLTGMSASVSRAVTMFSILAIGQLMGYKFFNLHAIFASAFFLLIFNPHFLFDIGFQLSYLAVLGIAFFYKPIYKVFNFRYKVFNYFWQGTVIGIAAQIGTLPLTLYYFNQFPNYFFLTNIGLLVLASVSLISVVVFLLLHWVPVVVDWLAFVVDFIFDVLSGFIKFINTLPGEVSIGFTPHYFHVLLLYLFTVLTFYFWNKSKELYFRFSLIGLFIIALFLIFDREMNKSKRELVVFNHYNKSVVIKENRQMFLLYDATKPQSESSINFLISGYQNSVGVNCKKIPIRKGDVFDLENNIMVESQADGWNIRYYDKKIFLTNTETLKDSTEQLLIVDGPWNYAFNFKNADYSVNDKALNLNP
ncbi:ComEC/Rec2 family competence protein [Brumimicrobium aurantiacum]|uniref:ComEC/Rec2 family competence protein n=1 Tax=Brumimicrobium aurantiacum TaxID=1737063 RepID=UPI000F4D6A19|nr:ComEC/Rec2 family competence protein [Brumimicrobium aurantiacum]